jgi:hypothetical protein
MGEKSLRERRIIIYNVCAMLFCADGEKEREGLGREWR